MLRIKTEKEFLSQYGEDWRRVVELHWSPNMDYLFGKLIDTSFMSEKYGNAKYTKDGWNISNDMVIEGPEIDWDESLKEILDL